MATFSSVTRQHVLQALAEHDARGAAEFLDAYGFVASPRWAVLHEDNEYDAKAVLGVAHRFATGRLATPAEVDNELDVAVAILRRRGFEVTEPASAVRAAPTRTTAPRAARTPATRTPATRVTPTREATPVTCPTCFMTLPATGRCDNCS